MHEHLLLGAGGAGLSNAEGELAANEDDDARWPGSGAAIEQDARPRRANSVTTGCCAAVLQMLASGVPWLALPAKRELELCASLAA